MGVGHDTNKRYVQPTNCSNKRKVGEKHEEEVKEMYSTRKEVFNVFLPPS